MSEEKANYEAKSGEKFRFTDGRWYKNGKLLEKAAFASKAGLALTVELLNTKRMSYDELFHFGNDPFEEQGILYYVETGDKRIQHTKLLTKK